MKLGGGEVLEEFWEVFEEDEEQGWGGVVADLAALLGREGFYERAEGELGLVFSLC